MKATNLELLFNSIETMKPQHLVYEANDEALLFYFQVTKNGKSYESKATIDWSGLNWLISKSSKLGYDIYDAVVTRLFESDSKIREYQFSEGMELSEAQFYAAA